jgi:hypothetical protein
VLRKIARAWVAEDSGVLRRQRRQGMVGVRGLLAVAAGQSGQDRGARGEVRVQSAGTAPVEMNAEFSQLRSRESAPDRALREFVDVEIEFQKGAFLQDAEEAAAGVRGLVKCRQMSRYLRALDGGNARLDSLRERCAQAVTRQVALIQPAQIAVALNAAEFRASSAVEGFYVAAAVRLLEMDFAELRTKDVILILGALARAATNSNFGARANSSTSPGTRLVVWSLQDGRRLALHLCRGLLAHRDRRNREMGVLGGGGLNSIDVAGVLNALGKLFPNSLGRRSVSGGYQWGEEGGGEWGGDGGGGDMAVVSKCVELVLEELMRMGPEKLGPQAVSNAVNGLARLFMHVSSSSSSSSSSSTTTTTTSAGAAEMLDGALVHLERAVTTFGGVGGGVAGDGGGDSAVRGLKRWSESVEPKHVSMLINGWARLNYAPADSTVEVLLQSCSLIIYSKAPSPSPSPSSSPTIPTPPPSAAPASARGGGGSRSGGGGGAGGGFRAVSRMTAQDVGLVSLGLSRLPYAPEAADAGGGGGGVRRKLMAAAFRCGVLLEVLRWDAQAVANTLTAYAQFRTDFRTDFRGTDFRTTSRARVPDLPGGGGWVPGGLGEWIYERGHAGVGGVGESRIVEVLCGVIEARAPALFDGRVNELASIALALPSCGVTARSHPALWVKLAQASMRLQTQDLMHEASSAASSSRAAAHLSMLINGFSAGGLLLCKQQQDSFSSTAATAATASAAANTTTSSSSLAATQAALRSHVRQLLNGFVSDSGPGPGAATLWASTPQPLATMANLLQALAAVDLADALLPRCEEFVDNHLVLCY